jgi:uncharacterized protein DUF6600
MKMLRAFAAALALTLGAALTAVAADPPSVAGRLNFVSGPVSFAPAEANEDWSAAVINRPITTGDRLWTDNGGRAEMHVGSLAIRMGSQTSLDVLNLDDRTMQLRLAQGSMNLRVRRLASDQLLEIATPSGAVVVRQPGSYRINVDASGFVAVTVRAGGQAEVFTGNSSFLVRDQQQAMLSGQRQDLYAAAPADEFDRWAAERDQRKDRIVSTRYVPEEMTGYEDLDEYGTWQTVPTYGAVWRPRAVPVGWAPYRHGHWIWVSPWGWTWVDDAPWGFAPSHYGRWVWLGNYWAWAPGRVVARPVYAPAVVAFIGGSNWSLSVASGPAVGWVPLGWREPYRPWYSHSPAHLRSVNVTHVTNVTNITNNVTNVTLVNRNAPSAVTVVSRENFVRARPVQQETIRVSAQAVAKAPVTRGAPVATPTRTSLAVAQSGSRPPAEVRTRETVAINTPPAPPRDVERAERKGKGKGRDDARVAARDSEDRPRVRVIDRQQAQRVELQAAQAPAPSAAQPQPQMKAGERAPDKAPPQAQEKAAPQPQAQAQGKAAPQAQEKAAPQAQEKAPPLAPQAQTERRVPAPPAEVSKRPTFDREMRQVAPQVDAKRDERKAERQERRDEARQKADQQRAQQQAQEQQQRQEQAAQERQAREQQTRQQQQAERQKAQQQEQQQRQQQAAQERQAREQQTRQQQQAERQQAQQQQAERQRAQQQQAERQQRAQQQQQQAAQERQGREQQARQRDAQQQQQRQREKAEKSDKKRDDQARDRRGDRSEKG